MFTGIVSDIGTIESLDQRGDLRVKIQCGYDMDSVDMGASIACSGVCLTVVDKGPGWFAVDVSGETLSCTADGQFAAGRRLNLERALKVGVIVRVSKELAPFVAAKGSITVNGVSLTVNAVSDKDTGTEFTLNIIPHTAQVTTLGELAPGRAVNLEIDILARYLARMEKVRNAVSGELVEPRLSSIGALRQAQG